MSLYELPVWNTWVPVAGLVAGAALLALSAILSALARDRRSTHEPVLMLAAALVGACAIVWPVQLGTLSADAPLRHPGQALVAFVLASSLIGCTQLASLLITRKTRAAAMGVAVTLPVLVFVLAMHANPNAGTTVHLTLAMVLPPALLLTHLPACLGLPAGLVRGAAALVCAAALTWAGWAGLPASWPESATPTAWHEFMALWVVGSMGAAMWWVMRRDAALPAAEALRAQPRNPMVTDTLTQLPTRAYFEKRLSNAVDRCDSQGHRLALLFIDLDGFKPVNDTFGHGHGDRVLERVGQRLRAVAGTSHVAARVGGDEFLLLMRAVSSHDDVALLAARLIKHLSQPYLVDAQQVSISCSIGIVIYPDAAGKAKLIARADAAMYAAKRSGGSCYCFYTPAMDADAQETFELLNGLREAVAKNQFELYYQPKVDARTGKFTAVEALVRWQHPTRGLILPGVFIPVAERFGLMGPIGNWVIEDACRQAREWRERGLRMRVAINLSALQMRQDDIADRIASALNRNKMDPSLLTCEITESAAMEDTRTTQEAFRRLGKLGVHMSIDDFGTGYSSLSYLRKLPAEELKIDRSFVVDVEHSADARAVVDAVVKLAHALSLKVVAEGVENQRQEQIMKDLGCDELQGYLFARPMTARALLILAAGDRPETADFQSSLFIEDEPRQVA